MAEEQRFVMMEEVTEICYDGEHLPSRQEVVEHHPCSLELSVHSQLPTAATHEENCRVTLQRCHRLAR